MSNRVKDKRSPIRGSAVLPLAALSCSLVVACTSPHEGEILSPPDMATELANANLSASSPRSNNSPNVEYSSTSFWDSEAELYPGSDEVVREKKKQVARREGIERVENGYQLNFNNVELSEVAKVILRDSLGVSYVYDPRVQGRVTVSTGAPVSRREIVSILESILAMNGGALIVNDNNFRIVPRAEGQADSALSVNYPREAKEVGAGYGVSFVPLKYVSSETMMRMFESLASKENQPRAIVHNNLLIIRGTGRQRESLLEIVYMFDVDWMKGQSAGIFTLENSSPDEVIKELQEVLQAGSQGKGLVRFQSIDRLNAILALTQKSRLLDEIDTWVSRLDRGGPEALNYYVYRVENGRATELAELLTTAFAAEGGTVRGAEEAEVAPTESAVRVVSQADEQTIAAGSAGGDTSTSPSSETTGISGPSTSQGTTHGIVITPDERNNKLLIKASGRDLRKILGILHQIDKPPLQVLINATFAEVTLNDNLAYGVQFFLEKKKGEEAFIGYSNGQQLEIAPNVPGLNFILGPVGIRPRVILDAIAAETALRVVSSPSVVTLHNRPATLNVGDEIPLLARSAVSVISPEAPVVNEIDYRNTGMTLKVTPRINSNGLVTMEIEQEISTVAGTASADTLTPTISQRRITSTIAVQSGQMVVLGGLIGERLVEDKSRIPIFRKIPYLGDMIGGNTGKSKSRTELVVFLQPMVIRDPQDASRVAEEVRARMQSLAPRPAAWDVQVQGSPFEPAK